MFDPHLFDQAVQAFVVLSLTDRAGGKKCIQQFLLTEKKRAFLLFLRVYCLIRRGFILFSAHHAPREFRLTVFDSTTPLIYMAPQYFSTESRRGDSAMSRDRRPPRSAFAVAGRRRRDSGHRTCDGVLPKKKLSKFLHSSAVNIRVIKRGRLLVFYKIHNGNPNNSLHPQIVQNTFPRRWD